MQGLFNLLSGGSWKACKRCLVCRVLSPYLKGGGAKSLDFQSLSQDLIRTSMQIPFSVPPYMSLLARSTATLEGIALMGDPNYQMVSQVGPRVKPHCCSG